MSAGDRGPQWVTAGLNGPVEPWAASPPSLGLDTCRPGDPMPHDPGVGICADRTTVRGRSLVCTRGPHATGQHVASGPVGLGALLRVIATWDDTGRLVRVWDGT